MVLSIVATPIGNLKDITLRAKEVLENATLILAEDTRSIKKLLTLLEIPLGGKHYLSSHAQSTPGALQKALEACTGHETIALVTDAGTPAISDPGSLFVQEFRRAYSEATVVPIPGVSAVVAALCVSGFPGNHFEFIGFVPHKKGRQTLFSTIAQTEHTVAMYESPHRILKTLEALASVLGDRLVMVGREMTKSFEEYPIGTAQELLDYYLDNAEKVRGEFVIVVSPSYNTPYHSSSSSDTIE
ncbi:MAG: 16S rRNA (cytidine(1402)-2'-O)-methyltransferase [Minisyncoccia bacterium]